MPPKFLLDENVEGLLWDALLRQPTSAMSAIQCLRVGDHPELPLGSSDPAVILWAQRHGYIIISHDMATLKDHFAAHLAAGNHSPGLFLFSHRAEIQPILEILAVASQSENHLEWLDLIEYLG